MTFWLSSLSIDIAHLLKLNFKNPFFFLFHDFRINAILIIRTLSSSGFEKRRLESKFLLPSAETAGPSLLTMRIISSDNPPIVKI